MAKKLYLCCREEKKEAVKERVAILLGSKRVLEESIENAELIYVVGEQDEKMKEEIARAKALGKEECYVNDNLINVDVFTSFIKDKVSVNKKQKAYSKELER